MLLHLLRHGPAEPGRWGQPDHERALTPDGFALMQRQAAALRHLTLAADVLLASPYRRAVQTATLVSQALGCSLDTEAALEPGGTLDDLAEVLARRDGCRHAWVVAHQPSLGQWTYRLTGARVQIRPGTLVVIEAQRLRPDGGTLHGVYAPEWLARLGGSLGPTSGAI